MAIDPNHPFFRPLWVRILTVAAPAAWAGFELYNGATMWAAAFAAAAAYAFYALFLRARSD
ncbi:hypothetical protein [Paracoccus pacificus]|uniref:DUF3329 domain-containing protein n=1 Tax=Paracoccus pacificus TaxID=1463598 RepID=A0ABW4R4H6_9RHOB